MHIARETAGAARTRSSLRPLFSRGTRSISKLRAHRAARVRSSVCRHCEERSDDMSAEAQRAKAEAIQLSVMPRNGLIRGACHRAALRADPLARNDGEGGAQP